MKKYLNLFVSLVLTVLAVLTGADGNVIMAAAGDPVPPSGMQDGGSTHGGMTGQDGGNVRTGKEGDGGTENINNTGVMTNTYVNEYGDEDFLVTDLDEKVMKIRPMSTPLEQITRGKGARKINSMITKYYSVGTRPVATKTAAAPTFSGDRGVIEVEDANIFSEDDTIRVVGFTGAGSQHGEDLMLKVIAYNEIDGKLAVYAVNGTTVNGQAIGVPTTIPVGTTLVRMGKACSEIDAQTGLFVNIPTAEEQYCQNFMLQVEQSTFSKLWKNEANWTFSDLEEEAVYDFKLTRELTSLFGVKNVIKHKSKKMQETYFTEGIWWMAGKDLELGHMEDGKLVIDEGDLVTFSKEAFIGVASNGRKVLFAGSDLVEAISKIKSERFRAKETVSIWDLTFTSFKTDFGEILLVHHELFNQAGMADKGFLLEDGYLEKRTFIAFEKAVKDFKTAGIRNTDGVVLQEVSCLVLKNAKAHARVELAHAA